MHDLIDDGGPEDATVMLWLVKVMWSIIIYLIMGCCPQLFCLLSSEHINSYSANRDNWCTVGGDGGCRVGEVRAGTTSPMPDHKGFKLQ